MHTFNINTDLFNKKLILNGAFVIKVDVVEARRSHSGLLHLLPENNKSHYLYLQPVAFDKENELKCMLLTGQPNIQTFYYLQQGNFKDLDCCTIVPKKDYLKEVLDQIK